LTRIVDEQWFEVQAGPFETTAEAEMARVNASRAAQGANPIPAMALHSLVEAKANIAFGGMFHVEKRPEVKGGPNRYYVVRQATVKVEVKED
jgi:hypothetical protein